MLIYPFDVPHQPILNEGPHRVNYTQSVRFKYLTRCCSTIIVGLAVSSCSHSNKTTELPNELKVTPVTIERNDVAQILDLKTWRLNVQLLKPNQTLNCSLEVRQKGKPPYSIGGIGVGPLNNSQTEVFVGLHPTSDSWSQSNQIKTIVRAGTGSSSGVKNNPFKNYGNFGYGDPQPQQDGSVLLMVASNGKSASWPIERDNDISLVLILKPTDVKYPVEFSN